MTAKTVDYFDRELETCNKPNKEGRVKSTWSMKMTLWKK